MRGSLRTIVIGCLAWLLTISVMAAPTYTVQDLGAIIPNAINNRGEVVGTIRNSEGWDQGVYWYGRLVPLTGLGGSVSRAYGINDQGVIVGQAQRPPREPAWGFHVPVLWQSGSPLQLDWKGADVSNVARAINSAGLIVGWTGHYDIPPEAATWKLGSVAVDLLPEFRPGRITVGSQAFSVNDRGQVVGFAEKSEGTYPVLWEDGKAISLPNLPGELVELNGAWDINNGGIAVGTSQNRPVVWEGGKVRMMRNGPGAALAVNDAGTIVGKMESFGAFRWEPETGMQNLNNWIPMGSGWVLTEARDVNLSGQIIGVGLYRGEWRAFLLNPVLRRWQR